MPLLLLPYTPANVLAPGPPVWLVAKPQGSPHRNVMLLLLLLALALALKQ
jgi:hypothetical protein